MTPADADATAHLFVERLGDRCDVDGADGHHLQRVRRVTTGERVTCADGTGAWRVYEVTDARRGHLVLEARGDTRIEPVPRVTVAVAVALARGALDTVAPSLTELGVSRLVPMVTERTVARPSPDAAARLVQRVRAIVREAAMQSRRARLPEVDDVATFAAVAARRGAVLADRSGRRAFDLTPPEAGEWTVLVGPEGGFSAAEREGFPDHARLALGDHVLRSVTAPVAAAAVLAERIAHLGWS